MQLNDAVNGLSPVGMRGRSTGNGSSPKQQLLEQFPQYEGLFGALDPCECEQCTSVISPAAYFVDMLQFLDGSTPNDYLPPGSSPPAGPSPKNSKGNTPLDVLIGKSGVLAGRRPDLAYLKLTCENTNTELPYIDLVNEVMESYILYSGPTQFAAHDTGETTTTELDASPQFTLEGAEYGIGGPSPSTFTAPDPTPQAGAPVKDGPYLTLANACYPFTLPFNESIAVARTYLKWLGSSRYQVMNTFQTSPTPAAAAIDAEYLQIDPYLYQLLTGTTLGGQPDPAPPTTAVLYGNPPAAPYATWETAVASVPRFLQQTGIQTTDVIALLQTRFVNPTLPLGPDRTFFNELPFDYATLMALVKAGFDPAAPAVLAADPTIATDLANAELAVEAIKEWWERNPKLGEALVIYCPKGSCDMTEASISQLSGLASAPPPAPSAAAPPPSPSPPSDSELSRMQAFIRLWRALDWSASDLDRAFVALGVDAVISGSSVLIPPAFFHDLAKIGELQASLNPPVLQVLFAPVGEPRPERRGLALPPAVCQSGRAAERSRLRARRRRRGAAGPHADGRRPHPSAGSRPASERQRPRADPRRRRPRRARRPADPGQRERAVPLRGAVAGAWHERRRLHHVEVALGARPVRLARRHRCVRRSSPARAAVELRRIAARLPLPGCIGAADGSRAAADRAPAASPTAARRPRPDRGPMRDRDRPEGHADGIDRHPARLQDGRRRDRGADQRHGRLHDATGDAAARLRLDGDRFAPWRRQPDVARAVDRLGAPGR